MESGRHLFELRPERAVSAEDEVYARVIAELLSKQRQNFQSLLHSHVAGVKQDNLAVADAKPPADSIGSAYRPYGIDVDPVGKMHDLAAADALFGEAADHVWGNAGDAGKSAHH